MTITIALFGLFHPQLLTVRPAAAEPVHIARPEAKQLRGRETLSIRGEARLEGDFLLAVPGRIERRFRGKLDVRRGKGELVAVLEADLEEAVAAVVAAEMPGLFAAEAQRAQAIVARSWYLASHQRHGDSDFCDTTHCQVMKDPSAARFAPLTLRYHGETLAPLYSASCGGETRSAAEVGMNGDPYPYFRVECAETAAEWERRFQGEQAAALQRAPHSERIRLQLGRALGWDSLPGNSYTMKMDGDELVLRGKGRGHGVGLCQQGAEAMARKGLNAAQILEHYFPNTSLGRMR